MLQSLTIDSGADGLSVYANDCSALSTVRGNSAGLETLECYNGAITRAELTAVPKLKTLKIQNNKLGSGTLQIGQEFKYNNGSWTTGDYRVGNNSELELTAYGNGIFRNNILYKYVDDGAYSLYDRFTIRSGYNIPSNSSFIRHYGKNWRNAGTGTHSGTLQLSANGNMTINYYHSDSNDGHGHECKWNNGEWSTASSVGITDGCWIEIYHGMYTNNSWVMGGWHEKELKSEVYLYPYG